MKMSIGERQQGITHNGRVLGEVALCVGFERWKPFCQAPVIASALLNELLTFKYK